MHAAMNFHSIVENHIAAHPDEQLYFLFDHAGLPGLKRLLDYCPMQWTSLFADTRESLAFSVSPLLVSAGSKDGLLPRWFFDAVEKQGMYASAVTLLASSLTFDELQRRLIARLDIKLSENMDAMLRFFDPRILAQLRTALTAEQATAFFGVATHWWYIDRAEVLQEFATPFLLNDDDHIPLVLTPAQEFELVDASDGDQVLSLLNDNVPNLLRKIPLNERYRLVAQNIVMARSTGLESIHDFTIYLTAVLHRGEEIVRESFPSRASSSNEENSILFHKAMATLIL